MNQQGPNLSVNVRFSPDEVAAIDLYAMNLSARRRTRVTRSDILRLALGSLAIPPNASTELSVAMERIGCKPQAPAPVSTAPSVVQEQLPAKQVVTRFKDGVK